MMDWKTYFGQAMVCQPNVVNVKFEDGWIKVGTIGGARYMARALNPALVSIAIPEGEYDYETPARELGLEIVRERLTDRTAEMLKDERAHLQAMQNKREYVERDRELLKALATAEPKD